MTGASCSTGPSLLSVRDVWERVQARLRANPLSTKVNSWLLTQVAFCAICESPMYGTTAKYGDKEYRYYGCVHSVRRDSLCVARRVKAEGLETALAHELLALAGHVELTEGHVVAGRGYSEEMARVADQISHLSRDVALGAVSGLTSGLTRKHYSGRTRNWGGWRPSSPWRPASSPCAPARRSGKSGCMS